MVAGSGSAPSATTGAPASRPAIEGRSASTPRPPPIAVGASVANRRCETVDGGAQRGVADGSGRDQGVARIERRPARPELQLDDALVLVNGDHLAGRFQGAGAPRAIAAFSLKSCAGKVKVWMVDLFSARGGISGCGSRPARHSASSNSSMCDRSWREKTAHQAGLLRDGGTRAGRPGDDASPRPRGRRQAARPPSRRPSARLRCAGRPSRRQLPRPPAAHDGSPVRACRQAVAAPPAQEQSSSVILADLIEKPVIAGSPPALVHDDTVAGRFDLSDPRRAQIELLHVLNRVCRARRSEPPLYHAVKVHKAVTAQEVVDLALAGACSIARRLSAVSS